MGNHGNRVLREGYRVSGNFYESDVVLRDHLRKYLSAEGLGYMGEKLDGMGRAAAVEMDELSLNADKNGPVLLKRDKYGETVDEVKFHPDYWRLMELAVGSEMMRVKWEPVLRKRFEGERHRAGFAAGYLYGMGESGQYCPLCMTDGAAHLVDRFAEEEDRARLLPRIATDKAGEFYTGAMFLTEKAGGSDVGANLVEARHVEGRMYKLYGEKWFCSNANADVIFVLARTRPEVKGTRGLSIFLVEPRLREGGRNALGMVRLKDKLGVRSMASAECVLDGTVGKLVGEEGQGFRIMTEMINLSRLYNSVAALAGGRRALVEAWQYLNYRDTFGKNALDHALVRAKVWELASLQLASFHLVWRTIRALDAAEAGDAREAELLRILTPMVKRDSAELAVYIARESMELMGGMGYIEDTVMPKIMRDMMVLPIWEGAGNIMVLDMLRASMGSERLDLLLGEIEGLCEGLAGGMEIVAGARRCVEGFKALQGEAQGVVEYQGKLIFGELTRWLQMALILREEGASGRSEPALAWLDAGRRAGLREPLGVEELKVLVGWEF